MTKTGRSSLTVTRLIAVTLAGGVVAGCVCPAPPPPPEPEPVEVAPPPPPPPPPPPRDEPLSRREPPPSPLDDLASREGRDRDRMGAPPQRPQRPPGQERPDSVWGFFMGLPWWSKLLAIFIAIQVILFIVSAVSGGGGGG